jgi:hypothetical protein
MVYRGKPDAAKYPLIAPDALIDAYLAARSELYRALSRMPSVRSAASVKPIDVEKLRWTALSTLSLTPIAALPMRRVRLSVFT